MWKAITKLLTGVRTGIVLVVYKMMVVTRITMKVMDQTRQRVVKTEKRKPSSIRPPMITIHVFDIPFFYKLIQGIVIERLQWA